ncbi:TPA: hypothetical protein ACH3X2_003773 [Trebouxia sp. C0005]
MISAVESVRLLLPQMPSLTPVSLLSPTTSISEGDVILQPQHLGGSCTSCEAQAAVSNLSCPFLTNLGPMMSVMANMQRVQRLELKGNIGISGPPADSSPSTSSGLCSAIQNGLQYLDFSNMDLTGSLPKCLLSAPGTLSQSALSSIDLTDTIPDIVPTSTPLYSLVLDYNLTGSIPATLVNARDLSSLELYSKKLASW